MGDDTAARDRMRRVRAHRKGDHSQGCTTGNCDALKAELNAPLEPPPGDDTVTPRSAAETLVEFLASMNLQPADPRDVVGCLAVKLAVMLDHGQGDPVRLAREIAGMVRQIGERPGEPADRVDEIRAERWQRRVAVMMAGIAGENGERL